jgi:hypothetical protein
LFALGVVTKLEELNRWGINKMVIPKEDQIKADNEANKEVEEHPDSFEYEYKFKGILDIESRISLHDDVKSLAMEYGIAWEEL